LFDYLTLTFLEGPEEERVEHFSVATHFPKVQLEDMAQTVEAAVSLVSCGAGACWIAGFTYGNYMYFQGNAVPYAGSCGLNCYCC
jgi:hypothetical protein